MSANSFRFEKDAHIFAFPVQDINGATLNEDYVSLKSYQELEIGIVVGNIAGTTSVTLKQATAVAGTGEKALGFSKIWKSAATSVALTETAVTSDTFDIEATDDNKIIWIPIDSSELDADNSFDCVRIDFTDPSAAALISCVYHLRGSRYAGATLVDPLVD